MLFGVPALKDAEGSEAGTPSGIAQRGLRALREELGADAVLISDLCLDEYTDHGHCGVLTDRAARSTTTAPSSSTGASPCRRPPRARTWSPRAA